MSDNKNNNKPSYKDTLNLPNTNFPMKASLTNMEPARLDKWDSEDVYNKVQSERKAGNAKKFVLHDGPPYANGHLHMGHTLNKLLKDFVLRSKSILGYETPYIAGWDCHGLPIEIQVEKKLGKTIANLSVAEIRQKCRDYANEYIDIQRSEFRRLGIFTDWSKIYKTMDFEYEGNIVKELYKFINNGSAYKGVKAIHWCTSCKTALAEAELEYHNHTSVSVYVKMPIETNKTFYGVKESDKISAVIWTTTPWTLPANTGIAFNPVMDYSIVKVNSTNNANLQAGEYLIVATSFIEQANSILKQFDVTDYTIIKHLKGSDFERHVAQHPFYNRTTLMVLADYVTDDAGTGIVHTAPGHGADDFNTGAKYNLEVLCPVDDSGVYFADLPIFGGQHIKKANDAIVEHIRQNGTLLLAEKLEHSYPHCWRCKNPLIFRATAQWFISMTATDIKERALKQLSDVKWQPSWGEIRIRSMIENRPDWCISRQRRWGTPIALFRCTKCGKILINEKLQEAIVEEFNKHSSDVWYSQPNEYFLNKVSGVQCGCGSTSFEKEEDILDVWFESGVSYSSIANVYKAFKEEEIDLYLEGSDQHRGWFQSSYINGIGTRGHAPFKEVVTHGFVVDGQGRKMSKSLGNGIELDEIAKKYGAEIARIWAASENYSEDVRISFGILDQLVESYRKIRNTARFILGCIDDFDPNTDNVKFDDLMELDKFVLYSWDNVKRRVIDCYEKYQYHVFYHTMLNFCIRDLSSFYLDILKDRAYISGKKSHKRRSAQTVLYKIIKEFAVLIYPILPFTADEIWEYIPHNTGRRVMFELINTNYYTPDDALIAKWERILEVRKTVNKSVEAARTNKLIGLGLQADVTLFVSDEVACSLNVDEEIKRVFIVSSVKVLTDKAEFEKLAKEQDSEHNTLSYSEDGAVGAFATLTKYERCERCWSHAPEVANSIEQLCDRCKDVLAGN